jgi:hypothetical protein
LSAAEAKLSAIDKLVVSVGAEDVKSSAGGTTLPAPVTPIPVAELPPVVPVFVDEFVPSGFILPPFLFLFGTSLFRNIPQRFRAIFKHYFYSLYSENNFSTSKNKTKTSQKLL